MPRARKPGVRPPARALSRRAAAILRRLRRAYPQAHCELVFSSPLELLIAAILSAQCTDRRVNQVTPGLFARYRTAADWAAIPPRELEAAIRSTGFFRNKARNILALTRVLAEHYAGAVPADLDTLVTLPGVGRKTANVLLISAFGQPGITVDTHCRRVSQRLGLTTEDNPDRIEFAIKALLPRASWAAFSHAVVFHGRYCCRARNPACAACPVADLCPSAEHAKDSDRSA